MKQLLLISILIFSCSSVYSSSKTDSLLIELDKELAIEEVYLANKNARIDGFHAQLRRVKEDDLTIKYDIYSMLYEEYKSFNFDSAFNYVYGLQNIAYRLRDETKINEAKIKLGFILLSSGMFKETLDSLNTVNTAPLPQTIQQEYFTLVARAYYDLADFNQDTYYTPVYTARGNIYVDSVLALADPGSYTFLYFRGLRSARMSNIKDGLADLEELNSRGGLSFHQAAVVSSTLSDLYLRIGETEKAIQLLAKAAIYDIKSSTKETAAILTLASILHEQGNISRAYRYTKKALAEANFYGARHRKIQVGTVLPIIEEEKLRTVESQKEQLIIYSIILTILAIAIVLFIFIILKQLKKIRLAKKEIDQANNVLQDTNYKLQEINHKLTEANKIKEEYIGYYFNINSEYVDKIEKFKRAIEQSLMAKKFDQIRYIVNNINLKKEREELFFSFDKVFLKLFPCFIPEFNSFFKEEDQIKLPDSQMLNTDLRIFALIRMGIQDNDKIAKILNYSVNTIYAYKTRIKNKSIIPNDEFEQKMMEIKPV